jgi:hypothetical protein
MDKEKLAPWLEKLAKADKKDYESIVADMAKGNTLKTADAWQLLKLAGFDPAGKQQSGQKSNQQGKADGEKTSVVLRHKTEYPHYRRAGLVLTQKPETYEVTVEQLALLKRDYWVVIGDDKKDNEKK